MTVQVGTDTEQLVHVAEPGFWCGELAVLTGQPAAVTFLARTPARTLLLPDAAFEELAARHPAFYRAVARLALGR
jgi:CRP-like cAMP-binding protein